MSGQTITKRNCYSLDDYKQIIAGEMPAPNFEPQPVALVANNIAALGHSMSPKWGWFANRSGRAWAMYFLTGGANMSGGLDGSGYVIAYGNDKDGAAPTVGRFAICKHEKVSDPSANPSRGWHPGHCGKCGLDMTIDSGD